MKVDPDLGAMMREALRRQQIAEMFDRTAITDGATFHMALIPSMAPDRNGYLEVALMENGRVKEIVGKSGRHPLDAFTVEAAEDWFQKIRIDWLDQQVHNAESAIERGQNDWAEGRR